MNALDNVKKLGVLPVIKIEDPETAVPLADALRNGGINAIEITLRNDTALEALGRIKKQYPDMTVGAGTVLTTEQADEAVAAGADFLVAPGFNREIVEHSIENGIPFVPGCTTASEMDEALRLGLTTVKFFPAETMGGVAALKLYSGPYSMLRFVPTGGVGFDNLESYLRAPFIAACGGSFIAKAELIRAHDWEAISENCRKAMKMSLGFELAHVGINNENEDSALANAKILEKMLGLPLRDGNSSAFCGKAVEFMKCRYYGENGHIGFYTNSVYRAKAWFEREGIAVREESLKTKPNGDWQSFYLEGEIGGFAIHVVAR